MLNLKKLKLVTSAILLTCGFAAQAKVHIVQKGETLASIARENYGEPVFGPKGTLNKIYQLNPWAKTSPSLVEPGQKVILEDKPVGPHAVVAAPILAPNPPPPRPVPESVEALHEAHSPPPPGPGAAPLEPPAHLAAAPVPPPPPPHAPPPPPPPHEAHHAEEPEEVASYFSVIPSYSQIHQVATDGATGTSYTLNSSSAYGVELAWDHAWNPAFSTVIAYAVTQMKTNATSDATGEKIFDSMTLNRYELLLMNRVLPKLRLGLGVAYGDHLFLEDFSATPADPKIYKTAFWNSLAAAEITAYETPGLEVGVSLKAAALPAQVGQGHDLRSGMEYFGQVSLLQKFDHWAMFYGVSFSTENQTRTDGSETREETALRIGALF